MEYAEKLKEGLINVPSGAMIFAVKGETPPQPLSFHCRIRSQCFRVRLFSPATEGYLALLSPSIVGQVFYKFLLRQPHVRSDLRPPRIPIRDRMAMALQALADFKNDPAITIQDPLSSLSFSCVSEEVEKSQMKAWNAYHTDERNAFSPLGSDGRPQRKCVRRVLSTCSTASPYMTFIADFQNGRTTTGCKQLQMGSRTRVSHCTPVTCRSHTLTLSLTQAASTSQ